MRFDAFQSTESSLVTENSTAMTVVEPPNRIVVVNSNSVARDDPRDKSWIVSSFIMKLNGQVKKPLFLIDCQEQGYTFRSNTICVQAFREHFLANFVTYSNNVK